MKKKMQLLLGIALHPQGWGSTTLTTTPILLTSYDHEYCKILLDLGKQSKHIFFYFKKNSHVTGVPECDILLLLTNTFFVSEMKLNLKTMQNIKFPKSNLIIFYFC